MGDLKTPFDKPIYPNTSDLPGDLATGRGTDPNGADTGGKPAGIINFWDDPKQPLPEDSGIPTAESANSVSGLPPLPNRFAPSEGVPEMPTLKDRVPGTIDKK